MRDIPREIMQKVANEVWLEYLNSELPMKPIELFELFLKKIEKVKK